MGGVSSPRAGPTEAEGGSVVEPPFHPEEAMTMDDKIKGKFEEVKGKLTGDKTEELKGKARQKVGDVKESAEELRRRAERGEAERTDEAPPEQRETMEPR
jgi:uncharacterized protein YjbJ (UPF0337 family)